MASSLYIIKKKTALRTELNCFSTNTNSCSFKNFHEEIMKQNKPNSSAAIKANLGCVQQFRCVYDTE